MTNALKDKIIITNEGIIFSVMKISKKDKNLSKLLFFLWPYISVVDGDVLIPNLLIDSDGLFKNIIKLDS